MGWDRLCDFLRKHVFFVVARIGVFKSFSYLKKAQDFIDSRAQVIIRNTFLLNTQLYLEIYLLLWNLRATCTFTSDLLSLTNRFLEQQHSSYADSKETFASSKWKQKFKSDSVFVLQLNKYCSSNNILVSQISLIKFSF